MLLPLCAQRVYLVGLPFNLALSTKDPKIRVSADCPSVDDQRLCVCICIRVSMYAYVCVLLKKVSFAGRRNTAEGLDLWEGLCLSFIT